MSDTYDIYATKKAGLGPTDSRHERITGRAVTIQEITVVTRNGVVRDFTDGEWDISIVPHCDDLDGYEHSVA